MPPEKRSVWSDLGGSAAMPWVPSDDHRTCTPRCAEAAIPSPLKRDRPPSVPCPHCGAVAGMACHVPARSRVRLTKFGRFHPSRLEVA